MKALQDCLEQGVEEGAFPSAQAVVLYQGQEVFSGRAGDATSSTLFDQASLTKVLCTTAIFAALWNEGKLEPGTKLARFFPHGPLAREDAELADLLYHRSGVPATSPFFVRLYQEGHACLWSANPSAKERAKAREAVVRWASEVELALPIRQRAVYSDVGFILLGEAMAMAANRPLDELFTQKVARPLGLESRFRRLSQSQVDPNVAIAPTGTARPRESVPGEVGGAEAIPRISSPPGEVDDDNAWAMDGVAGHAGLFGTALDVARFGQAVIEGVERGNALASQSIWKQIVELDRSTKDSSRAMGFDTPSAPSSSGRYFGRTPPGAVGHLAFTGTSLWVDLAKKLVVALSTNRTYFGRAEVRIRNFRPRFHDLVVESLKLDGG